MIFFSPLFRLSKHLMKKSTARSCCFFCFCSLTIAPINIQASRKKPYICYRCIIIFLKKDCVFIRQSDKQTEGEIKGKIFDSMIHSPSSPNGLSCSDPKAATRNLELPLGLPCQCRVSRLWSQGLNLFENK